MPLFLLANIGTLFNGQSNQWHRSNIRQALAATMTNSLHACSESLHSLLDLEGPTLHIRNMRLRVQLQSGACRLEVIALR